MKILKVIKKLSFRNKAMAYWLAGWCVVAPFSGVLKWRPHVFLTGGSGTGKTQVIKLIVNVLVGDFLIQTFGNSSEASLRRGMDGDGIPVLIDEGEPAKERASSLQTPKLIELARVASSDLHGLGIMRVDGNRLVDYKVRSCFLFSAIIESLVKAADVSRFSVMELIKGFSVDSWPTFKKEITTTITKGTAERLKARVIKNYQILEHNIDSFKEAVSEIFENSRIGDQIGTLLAGALFLKSLKTYSIDEAKREIEDANIKSALEFLDLSRDEMKCFNIIMGHMVRDLDNKTIISALNEYHYLLECNSGDMDRRKEIKKRLEPYCIDFREHSGKTYLFIAVGNEHIEDLLRNTDFVNYANVLSRLDFYVGKKANVRFGDHGKKTALYFDPAAVLNDEYEE